MMVKRASEPKIEREGKACGRREEKQPLGF